MSATINHVFGDVMNSRFIPEYKIFDNEYFIFSAYKFYKFNRSYQELKQKGIHEYSNHYGKIILDSGGFQLINKEIKLDYKDNAENSRNQPEL